MLRAGLDESTPAPGRARPGRGSAWLVALPLSASLCACPSGPLEAARRLAEAGKHIEAGDAFLAVARADPAHLAAWDGAVEAYCVQAVHIGHCLKVLDLELDRLGNIERHHDALSIALERRARSRLDAGLAEAALEDLERASAAAPDRASVQVARARALVMLGRRQPALEALEEAARLDPKNPEIAEVRRTVPAPTVAPSPEGEGFGGEGH